MKTKKQRTGIIYQAYNKISKKSYIGQTINGLKRRVQSHISKAKNTDIKTVKFHNALRKYKPEDWEWSIIESNIPKEHLDEKEIYYIDIHDTYYNGYNSTLGGSNITIPAKVYKLYHKNHGWVEMTVQEFSDVYSIKKNTIASVACGQRKQAFGWCKNIRNKDKGTNKNKLSPVKRKIQKVHKKIYTVKNIDDKGRVKIVKGFPLDVAAELNIPKKLVYHLIKKGKYKTFSTIGEPEPTVRYYLEKQYRSVKYELKYLEIIRDDTI